MHTGTLSLDSFFASHELSITMLQLRLSVDLSFNELLQLFEALRGSRLFVGVHQRICSCVCVTEREREGDSERDGAKVSEREREHAQERARARAREHLFV